MARIRSIKPEFWTDEVLAELPRDTRLLFVGLWNHVDDAGRCVFNPKLIKAAVFPLDDDLTAESIRRMIDELSTKDRVRVYEVSGRRYLRVLNFTKHQKIDRPKESTIPPPEEGVEVPVVPDQPLFVESSSNDQRNVVDRSSLDRDLDQGRDLTIAPTPSPPKLRKVDEVWDALMAACSIDPSELTPSLRGAANKAVSELRGVNATPDEIRIRAQRFRERYADMTLSPTALAKNWPMLTEDRKPPTSLLDRMAKRGAPT